MDETKPQGRTVSSANANESLKGLPSVNVWFWPMKDTTFLKQIISEYSKWTDGYAYMVPFTTAINMHCTYTFILTELDQGASESLQSI